MGTLVEVGRHRMTLEQFQSVIEGKNRCKAGESMPGNALFLEDVKYPFDDKRMNGRKINDENNVLRNNTGITALSRSDCFLKES